MPDGTGTEQTPGSDQQIDGQVAIVNLLDALPFFGDAARNAYVSGGGGAGGKFEISSLAELDALIGQWESLVEQMDISRQKLQQASRHVQPPANDMPSRSEAKATLESITAAIDHNVSMRNYADAYVKKLKAARTDYAGTESDNAAAVNRSDGA
ncbi:hypothetical protein ACFQV2_02170 [Actinokineospora soli]|uniref:PE family protein n=1 Tax=Actinokineospora soli TaxID=1048753 RepID=A0ABW2THV0_9PSEU